MRTARRHDRISIFRQRPLTTRPGLPEVPARPSYFALDTASREPAFVRIGSAARPIAGVGERAGAWTQRTLKRGIDVIGSLALLLVAAPVLLVLAVLVRLDSRGPAIYRSPRIGRDGSTFDCLKFRTMHVDAEERLQEVLASDPAKAAQYAEYHKLTDDPRVTRAGRLLRSTSLDELPQLFNVLMGTMSLVGPRPYLVRERDDMGPAHDVITRVPPGITGAWQVSGRNDVTFEDRLTLERDYVQRWSLLWDLQLLLRTPAAVLARKTG